VGTATSRDFKPGRNTVLDTDTVLNAISWELDRLIQDINKKIIRFGLSINAKVGSTLTLLFIYQNKYFIKHVGTAEYTELTVPSQNLRKIIRGLPSK